MASDFQAVRITSKIDKGLPTLTSKLELRSRRSLFEISWNSCNGDPLAQSAWHDGQSSAAALRQKPVLRCCLPCLLCCLPVTNHAAALFLLWHTHNLRSPDTARWWQMWNCMQKSELYIRLNCLKTRIILPKYPAKLSSRSILLNCCRARQMAGKSRPQCFGTEWRSLRHIQVLGGWVKNWKDNLSWKYNLNLTILRGGWVGGWYGGEVLRGDIHNDFTCRSRAKNAFISLNGIRYFEIVIKTEAGCLPAGT